MNREEREHNDEWVRVLTKHIKALEFLIEAVNDHQRIQAAQAVADRSQIN